MLKLLCQTTPELEVIVDGLLPVMNVLLHVFSLFQICDAGRTLAALGMLSNIPTHHQLQLSHLEQDGSSVNS